MPVFGSMTLLMVLGVVFFLVVGILMILKALGTPLIGRGVKLCGICRHGNESRAKFCAHCGKPLA